MSRKRFKRSPEADASRLIRHAAQLIADRGWRRFDFGKPELGFCMLGAINYASGSSSAKPSPESSTVRDLFIRWLEPKYGKLDIASVNDIRMTNSDEVIALMIEFAEELDLQAQTR